MRFTEKHTYAARAARVSVTVLLLLLLLPLWAVAEDGVWTTETLPIPYLKDARRHVSNPDSVLSAAAVDSIDRTLSLLESEKGVQTVVVAVKRIEGGDAYSFGMELARRYGVGSKKNTGLVVLLSTEDRCYTILTGSGLEGTLPDAVCRRVQNRVMVPALKESDWDGAIRATVDTLAACVRGDSALAVEEGDDDDLDAWDLSVIAAFVCGVGALGVWSHRRQRRCPRCKSQMKEIGVSEVTSPPGKARRIRRLRCPKCGFERNLVENVSKDGSDDGFPPIFGGGSGRSSSGGTFGGGSFGGGGSSGRF